MLNSNLDLSFIAKEKIRKLDFSYLDIGGDSTFSFMKENGNNSKPFIALEIPYIFDDAYPQILKDKWMASDFEELFFEAMKSNADLVSIKFNLSKNNIDNELHNIKFFLDSVKNKVTKPLILRGANNTLIDKLLVPFLAQNAPVESIIAFAEEETYETIIPTVVQNNHVLVLRTPIDINLAKELNVLAIDKGLSPNKILIDPDMGGLGYGLEYGYSIIEKIRIAGFDGDNMLNMPIIAFIGEESYRAKEAKSDTFSKEWGNFETRSTMWEISGATAMISAGANIVVVWNPTSIDVLKGLTAWN